MSDSPTLIHLIEKHQLVGVVWTSLQILDWQKSESQAQKELGGGRKHTMNLFYYFNPNLSGSRN